MRKLALVLALAQALVASVVRADNGLLYVGAGVSRDTLSDIVDTITNSTANIDGTFWRLYAGLRPLSAFAIEADYLDFGNQTGTFFQPGVGACAINAPNCAVVNIRTDGRAFGAYAVGFLPIPLPSLDVFGKAGLARWSLSNASPAPLAGSSASSGTRFAWGVGSQARLGNFGARLEYENFRIPGTKGADVVSLEVFVNIF